jgi:CheY-like chemotaxis protein
MRWRAGVFTVRGAGYSVLGASHPQEGLELFATRPIDAVVLDYLMPEMDGAEVEGKMKRIKPDVVIIMMSGISALPELKHVDTRITKGLPPSVLLDTIDRLLHVSG